MKLRKSKTKLQLNLESKEEVEAFKMAVDQFMEIIYEDASTEIGPDDVYESDELMNKISKRL